MISVLYYLTFGVLLAISLRLIHRMVLQIRDGISPVPNRARIQSPIGSIDVAFTFVIWIAGQYAASFLVARALGLSIKDLAQAGFDQQATIILYLAAGQLIATLLALTVIGLRYRFVPRIFGVQPEHVTTDLRLSLWTFAAVIPAILLVQLLLTQLVDYEHSTLKTLVENRSGRTIVITWMAAVFVAPVCEEIFFRGLLQNWLQRIGDHNDPVLHPMIGGWAQITGEHMPLGSSESKSDGNLETVENSPTDAPCFRPQLVFWDSKARWMPVFVSAGLFALVHVGQGPAPIPLFLLGLALGYIYRQTGSIIPCVLVHMMLNGYTMFWVTLQVIFPEAPLVN